MPPEEPSVDEELIVTKLGRMREYTGYLAELQKATLDELADDFKLRGAVERYLHTSMECLIDISNEIVSSLQLRRPERYRDVPFILAGAGVIPREFAETLATMIGFRNLLVHAYASINLRLVHQFLRTRLADFETFMRHIARFLKKA